MLDDANRTVRIAEKIGPERFTDEHYRAIFHAMLDLGDEFTIERLAERLEREAIDVLNGLREEGDAQNDPDKTIAASIAVIAMRDIDMELAEIDRMMSLATVPEQNELMMKKQRLQKEIEQLGQPAAKSFKFLKRRHPAPTE
jgi:hypothetical protein